MDNPSDQVVHTLENHQQEFKGIGAIVILALFATWFFVQTSYISINTAIIATLIILILGAIYFWWVTENRARYLPNLTQEEQNQYNADQIRDQRSYVILTAVATAVGALGNIIVTGSILRGGYLFIPVLILIGAIIHYRRTKKS